MTRPTRDMSDLHEGRLAERLGGRVSRGSGSTFVDQADGRRPHGGRFAFAWDGKSTLGKSISVTRQMWLKVVEQAGWARPMLAFGFFQDTRLSGFEFSLVAVRDDDFAELLADVDAHEALRHRVRDLARWAGENAGYVSNSDLLRLLED